MTSSTAAHWQQAAVVVDIAAEVATSAASPHAVHLVKATPGTTAAGAAPVVA
jgi:hypothetical protein